MKDKAQKVLFLDRDGVINQDDGYVYRKEAFIFCDGIFSLLKKAQSEGYLLIVVTNQSGIARGYYTPEDFERVMAYMREVFKKEGIEISSVYHCPHGPDDGCTCRKPKAGLFEQATRDFDVDMQHSWMIGDSERDIVAAKAAGISQTILLTKESKTSEAEYQVESLGAASALIMIRRED